MQILPEDEIKLHFSTKQSIIAIVNQITQSQLIIRTNKDNIHAKKSIPLFHWTSQYNDNKNSNTLQKDKEEYFCYTLLISKSRKINKY